MKNKTEQQTEQHDYVDNVLIKLRRKYKKHEVISALYKKISDFDLEKGKLLSEIDFLKSELGKKNNEIEILAVKRIQEHPMWIRQKELIKKRGAEITKLKKEKIELIIKLNKK